MKIVGLISSILTFLTLFLGSFASAQEQMSMSVQAGAVKSADSYKSKYFSNRMSSEQCGSVLEQIMIINAHKTSDANLNALLDAISVECGLSTKEPNINFAPVLYKFEASALQILWDGKDISTNEKAEMTYTYTMPPSFNNIVTIKVAQTKTENKSVGSGIINSLVQKLTDIKDHLVAIKRNGETHIILSGIAWHDRGTYTREKINELNEKAYGVGVERVIINKNGNREAVGLMVISDSHADPQLSASYEWQAGFHASKNVSFWAGASAGFVMRSDFNYMPVPFVLPTLGVTVGKISIRSVLIPSMGGVNNGNVVFIFASMPLK